MEIIYSTAAKLSVIKFMRHQCPLDIKQLYDHQIWRAGTSRGVDATETN